MLQKKMKREPNEIPVPENLVQDRIKKSQELPFKNKHGTKHNKQKQNFPKF